MAAGRFLRHLFTPDWIAFGPFPAGVLEKIGKAVADSETLHRGEIRFAVDGALPVMQLKLPVRALAERAFAELRVWDTEENSGVLVYVQLLDRRIEIVADRGIAARVPQAEWDEICRGMESAFRSGRYEEGAVEGIQAITRLLLTHFPARGQNPNELPDKPVRL